MGYRKGELSKEHIVKSATEVILSRGFAASSTSDLASAAGITFGKLTHHFPTKVALFEEALHVLLVHYVEHVLRPLENKSIEPLDRIDQFLDAMLEFYRNMPAPVGCPIGLTASDTTSTTPTMRQGVTAILQRTEKLLQKTFLELNSSKEKARMKAVLFIDTWQGAVLRARSAGDLEEIQRAFAALRLLCTSC
jgi:TetR/AcrR family transcriptional repressor of nem operon